MTQSKTRGDIAPPVAAKAPARRSAHGAHWIDDYAWIRAENWREVLRDPERAAARHPSAARGRERLCRGNARPRQALQRATRARNARAPKGGRQRSRRRRTGRSPITRAFATAASTDLSAAGRARAARRRCCSTATRAPRARRSSSLGDARHSPDHRKFAWSADEQGLGNVRDPRARRRRGRRLRRPRRERGAAIVWTRDSLGVPLCLAGREPSPVPGDAASSGHGRQAPTSAFTRRRTPPGSSASRRTRLAAPRVHPRSMATIPPRRTSSIWSDPPPPPRLIAPRRPGLRYRADGSWRRFLHQDQQPTARRTSRSSSRRPRRPRRRTGASSCRHGRAADRGRGLVQGLSGAAGARGQRAAHRRSRISRAARSMRSRFEARDLLPETGDRASNSTRPSSASAIPRWTAARRPTITTWRLRQRMLRKKQMAPQDFDAAGLCRRGACSRRRRTARACRSRCCYRRDTPIDGTAPLLIYGYGAYGHVDGRVLLDQSAVAGRSRLRLRHRACARRHRQGLALVRGGQARQEGQYFRRFHRRDAPSDRARLCRPAPHRRAWRQRGRHADGRHRQSRRRNSSPASSPTCPSSMC